MSLLLITLAAAAVNPNADILAAADAFDQAQLAQDRPAMERMILDNLVFVDGSGKRLGKQDLIDGWMGPGDKYDPAPPTDRVVTQLGRDAAVVNAAVNLCGTSNGARFCSHIRFADTFVRIGGHWRVAHIQVTRIKD